MNETMNLRPLYEWIGMRCLVSNRVSGNVRRLWQSYSAHCKRAGAVAERHAFIQVLATEFHIYGGLAGGLCLAEDAAAFAKAYPDGWREEAVKAHQKRRIAAVRRRPYQHTPDEPGIPDRLQAA